MSIGLLTRYGLSQAPPGGGPTPPATEVGVVSFTSNAAINTGSQEGWEFTASQALVVTALRIKTQASTDPTVRLWRVSDSALLASVTFSAIDNTRFYEIELDTPVELASGANYVITARRGISGNTHHSSSDVSSQVTFSDKIAYVQGRGINSDAFPTATRANEARSLADIRFIP